jgi:hypothetical protein
MLYLSYNTIPEAIESHPKEGRTPDCRGFTLHEFGVQKVNMVPYLCESSR